jgi:chaperonin GroES
MSVKKIKPLGKRVLVKRAEATVTKGGIFLPDSAQEKPKQGEVIATGPGSMQDDGTVIPLDLKVGDRVLFGAFAGTEVKTDEEDDYLLMSEEDVLAVVE